MRNARAATLAGCLLVLLVVAPGCLMRRRPIIRAKTATGAPRKLITTSREALVRRLRDQYDAVRSFNATVDMTPALGSVYKGSITEYKDIRAYVLYRKPSDIRVIGLFPVVRSKAFDMVSNGQEFRISIPSKNRFVEGRNDAPPISKTSLENLRPEAFLDAMVVPPPDLPTEKALMVDATDEEHSLYELLLVTNDMVNRTIFFDRTTLYVVRQQKYDARGNILSDTRYNNYKTYNGISFPTNIDINRPEDGYGVVMGVVKLDMNPDIKDDKFVLQRPEGSQLQVIGSTPQPGPTR